MNNPIFSHTVQSHYSLRRFTVCMYIWLFCNQSVGQISVMSWVDVQTRVCSTSARYTLNQETMPLATVAVLCSLQKQTHHARIRLLKKTKTSCCMFPDRRNPLPTCHPSAIINVLWAHQAVVMPMVKNPLGLSIWCWILMCAFTVWSHWQIWERNYFKPSTCILLNQIMFSNSTLFFI